MNMAQRQVHIWYNDYCHVKKEEKHGKGKTLDLGQKSLGAEAQTETLLAVTGYLVFFSVPLMYNTFNRLVSNFYIFLSSSCLLVLNSGKIQTRSLVE